MTSIPQDPGDVRARLQLALRAATEAQRREITGEEAAGIVRAEVAERRAAARHYHAAGQPEQAERLLREAHVLEELC